uniref:Uncharacterized protein n=1 Tax=Parascaris equorum TaxID=6256 RepID=A0A914RMI0_PAREQ
MTPSKTEDCIGGRKPKIQWFLNGSCRTKRRESKVNRVFRIEKTMKWSFTAALLVLYGFTKDFKPGEPFLFKYQTEFLNLTEHQLNGDPILILESIGYMVFRSTLVFGWGVFSQQVGMAFYGIASAAEIAFYSYIYAKVDKGDYQKLTSWTRASTMAGRTFGYLLSQLIIITHIGNYLIFVQRSILGTNPNGRFIAPQTYFAYVCYRLRKIRSDAKRIYSDGFIRKWSLWWAMTTCMSLQVCLVEISISSGVYL